MRKIILVAIGALLILSGVVDGLVGVMTQVSWWLIGIGAVVLVGLGIWEGWINKLIHPLMAFAGVLITTGYAQAMPYDQVLTPPEKIPMLNWNPAAVLEAEFWGWVFAIVVVIAIAWFVDFALYDEN